jgi:hypothetical protein
MASQGQFFEFPTMSSSAQVPLTPLLASFRTAAKLIMRLQLFDMPRRGAIAIEMIPAIVAKLQKELAQPIVCESQVVYLLVEIR